MDRNEVKQRLELALRLVKPPTLEEVLEQVSRRGVLRGPVDWVFPAWMLYVEYATQKIAETLAAEQTLNPRSCRIHALRIIARVVECGVLVTFVVG